MGKHKGSKWMKGERETKDEGEIDKWIYIEKVSPEQTRFGAAVYVIRGSISYLDSL